MTMRPCIECGELSNESRCSEHKLQGGKHVQTAEQRGYNYAWRRLSERARKLQPFCTDCGATDDLQADHSVEAWKRKQAGKPIRLKDVDVVCGPCNRKRGPARETKTTKTEVGGIPA